MRKGILAGLGVLAVILMGWQAHALNFISDESRFIVGLAHVSKASDNHIHLDGCATYSVRDTEGSFSTGDCEQNPTWVTIGGHSYTGTMPATLEALAMGQFRDRSASECLAGYVEIYRYRTGAHAVASECPGDDQEFVGAAYSMETSCANDFDTRDGTMDTSFSFAHEIADITSSGYRYYNDWVLTAFSHNGTTWTPVPAGFSCYRVYWHP